MREALLGALRLGDRLLGLGDFGFRFAAGGQFFDRDLGIFLTAGLEMRKKFFNIAMTFHSFALPTKSSRTYFENGASPHVHCSPTYLLPMFKLDEMGTMRLWKVNS